MFAILSRSVLAYFDFLHKNLPTENSANSKRERRKDDAHDFTKNEISFLPFSFSRFVQITIYFCNHTTIHCKMSIFWQVKRKCRNLFSTHQQTVIPAATDHPVLLDTGVINYVQLNKILLLYWFTNVHFL